MAEELKQCPFCGGEPNLTHSDYVHDDLRPMPVVECKSCSAWVREEDWNRRAQQSSQVGEAVEVVAYRYTSSARLGGKWHYQESFPKWDDRKVSEIGQMDALMTVAQHNRIMAAATPTDIRVVPVELLEVCVKRWSILANEFITGSPSYEEEQLQIGKLRALLEVIYERG